MMSIFILIGAYRYYAALAERFRKTKWHFGLLGIAVYLGFQVLFLFCYGIYEAFTNPDSLSDNNYAGFSLLNLISWLLAIVAVYAVHKVLENKFKRENLEKPMWEIDEIGKSDLQ